MTAIETTIDKLLEQGRDVVLATIIQQSGSTPRTSGAKMIVYPDGRIEGTVGGGLVEANVIQQAQSVYAHRRSTILPFDLTSDKVLSTMDLICGGTLEVLIEFIPADEVNRAFFSALVQAVEAGEPCSVAIALGADSDSMEIQRFLLGPDGCLAGSQPLPPATAGQLHRDAWHAVGTTLVDLDGQRYAVERCVCRSALFIFGAGHVSQDVARMARMVDFRVVVLDDRAEFCSRERFADAHQLIVLDDFEDAFAAPTLIEPDSAVVILTRGHRHDKTVLAQALRTPAGYIGMIGSRRKRELIYRSLLENGFTQLDLQRVHSPIGLPIGAETPVEIAVSIVAELIQARSQTIQSGSSQV